MNRDIYELIEKMIDKKVKGADTYINNGSRWLIFTDEKKWIFELTKEGTLWYNYYFFENIFKIISAHQTCSNLPPHYLFGKLNKSLESFIICHTIAASYLFNYLVETVGMKVVAGPTSVYVSDPGNEGLTGTVTLATSHASVHIWDNLELPMVQFDIYSCKEFSLEQVMGCFVSWGLVKAEWVMIDRWIRFINCPKTKLF